MSYGDPVVLHETKRSRIVFVPFFIQHTTQTELAGKVITYHKGEPPMDWEISQEKSISFEGATLMNLLRALREHLAVAEKNADGEYLAIPLGTGTSNLAEHDPEAVAKALTKVLSTPEIAKHIKGTDLSAELHSALRNAVRLSEMRSAVAQLRQHLDGGANGEGPIKTGARAIAGHSATRMSCGTR